MDHLYRDDSSAYREVILFRLFFSNGQYQGLSALSEFNMFVFRIAFASFCAYVFGQLLDVLVFNRLRQLKRGGLPRVVP